MERANAFPGRNGLIPVSRDHSPSRLRRIEVALGEIGVRLMATDPGLVRTRLALRVTLTAALVLGCLILATKTLLPLSAAAFSAGLLFAIQGVVAIRDASASARLQTRLISGAAGLAMLTLCSVLVPSPGVVDGLFLLVAFAAVYMRRWGQRWTAVGMFAFMASFAGAYFRPTLGDIPGIALAIATTGTAAHLVREVLVRDRPLGDLRRALAGVDHRVGRVAALIGEGGRNGWSAARRRAVRAAPTERARCARRGRIAPARRAAARRRRPGRNAACDRTLRSQPRLGDRAGGSLRTGGGERGGPAASRREPAAACPVAPPAAPRGRRSDGGRSRRRPGAHAHRSHRPRDAGLEGRFAAPRPPGDARLRHRDGGRHVAFRRPLVLGRADGVSRLHQRPVARRHRLARDRTCRRHRGRHHGGHGSCDDAARRADPEPGALRGLHLPRLLLPSGVLRHDDVLPDRDPVAGLRTPRELHAGASGASRWRRR